MSVRSATVRMLNTAETIHIERAKLRAAMEALMEIAGFEATVAACQTEIQALAERARRMGISTDGWIG